MNKPTIITILIILILTALLVGCSSSSRNTAESEQDYPFVNLGYANPSKDGIIIYDKETKVMYWSSWTIRNFGNLTMLVNADGTPKLYKK